NRGTWTGSAIISSNYKRYWELDQLGNWPKLRNGLTGSTNIIQERTHNEVNELTGFTTPGSAVDPVHDNAGNMTTAHSPKNLSTALTLKYDAWNRLTQVKNSGGTTITANKYDGLNRRIVRDETGGSGTLKHFYYNEQWQVLVEADNSLTATAMYAYHPHY